MKILFYCSHPYDWRVGGVVVQLKLADLLTSLGLETYILGNKSWEQGNTKRVSELKAHWLVSQKDCIVIYPETVIGNPLNAKNVARWILFFPGGLGGDTGYSEKEFIFTYHKEYVVNTIYKNCPEIKISGVMTDKFYDLYLLRNKNGMLIKKGYENLKERKSLFFDPFARDIEEFESVDEVLKNCVNPEEFNTKLNQYKYFVSFDNYTYHNVLAALAGCISVVIPNTQGNSSKFPIEDEIVKDYVFYGFDQFKGVLPNTEGLREILRYDELKNQKATIELVKSCKNYFPHTERKPTLLNQFTSNLIWFFLIFTKLLKKFFDSKPNTRIRF